MIRRPPRPTLSSSSAASDVYKRQGINAEYMGGHGARHLILIHGRQVAVRGDVRRALAVEDAGVGKTGIGGELPEHVLHHGQLGGQGTPFGLLVRLAPGHPAEDGGQVALHGVHLGRVQPEQIGLDQPVTLPGEVVQPSRDHLLAAVGKQGQPFLLVSSPSACLLETARLARTRIPAEMTRTTARTTAILTPCPAPPRLIGTSLVLCCCVMTHSIWLFCGPPRRRRYFFFTRWNADFLLAGTCIQRNSSFTEYWGRQCLYLTWDRTMTVWLSKTQTSSGRYTTRTACPMLRMRSMTATMRMSSPENPSSRSAQNLAMAQSSQSPDFITNSVGEAQQSLWPQLALSSRQGH
eukprot:TRINITY_DN3296_c0_g1_i2.p1 TRINITY_DN3296_c0_g1~~TRINITY_DN3296_c0_g1_i2.p1  ORF type:complete len:350 (+),score=79.87 TRINITY_DN3296_c0_g1_i2:125-1174(+)